MKKLFFIFLLCSQAHAETFYDYKILRVIDGDTLEIEAPYLPKELGKTLHLRLLGVDTPEKGWLAKCKLENAKSFEAENYVEETLKHAKETRIVLKKWDKFGGRVLGFVFIDDVSLSDLLIKNGYAISYNGEKKVHDWCNNKKD